MLLALAIGLKIMQSAHPAQVLPTGFPASSIPPLESYCPPESSGFNLSTVEGLIHPVTDWKHLDRNFILYVVENRRTLHIHPCLRPRFEFNLRPKHGGYRALLVRGACRRRAICRCTARVFTVTDVCLRVPIYQINISTKTVALGPYFGTIKLER